MTEPATPFWEGYRTTPEVRKRLLEKIAVVWGTYPGMRLGQLISNLTVNVDLFGVWDEDLELRIDRITEAGW